MSLTFDTPQALRSHYAAVLRRTRGPIEPTRPAPARVLTIAGPKVRLAEKPVEPVPPPALRARWGDDQDMHVRAYRRHLTIFPQSLPPVVINAVASAFSVGREDILSTNRRQPVAFARQVAMWILRRRTVKSYPQIGAVFGGYNHATVIHAVRAVEARKGEPELAARLAAIEAEVDANWRGRG